MSVAARLRSIHAGIVLLVLGLAFPAWAAKVPFEITFTHSGTTPPKRPLSHIFVLDRSGSMYNNRDAECERNGKRVLCNRWEALKDSLRKTLANTPDKTELRFIIVDGDRSESGFLLFEKDKIKSDNVFFSSLGFGGEEMTDTIVMSDKYREPSEISAIIKRLGEPGGNTPLYDTLQDVMIKAWDLFKEGKRVSVFVFSDGDNVGGRLRSEEDLKRSLIRRQVPKDMVSHLSFLPIWVSKSKPGKKLFDTEWLEPGTVPMVATVESSQRGLVLDNPVSGKLTPIKLGFDFKVSDEIWSKIKKYTDELIVYDGEGRRVASYPIRFNEKEVFSINIDEKYLSPTRDNFFQIQLKCEFPKGSYITCDKPDPIRLTFAKAGEVSVAIVSPRPSQVVKCGGKGEVVKFEAMVQPANAVCTWDFGDGSSKRKGPCVEHRYLKRGMFSYSVRAEVPTLNPGGAKGMIKAEEASVSLVLPKEKVSVGEQAVIKAVGEGPILRYEWSVAGIDVEGVDAKDGRSSELRWKPDVPGKVAISVRAVMKGEMKSESDSKIISVAAKPYVGIVLPKPGFEAEIGTSMPILARAVNVDTVKFNVYGEGHKLVVTQPGSAIKDNVSEAMLNLKEAGNYQIEVEGGDGVAKSVPINIYIKAEQLKVFIDSPKKGEPCKASEHKKIVAHVKGSRALLDECCGLAWEVNGTSIPNGSGKINDRGEMSVVWTIPDEFARKECVLRAYALDKNGSKTSVYDEVTIEPSIEGSIRIVQPSNDKHVPFDDAFDLKAEPGGRVKGVTWFAEVDGKSVPIGSGMQREYRVKHTGQKKAVVRLHAEAEMPAGDPLKSDEVVVTAFCPDVQVEMQQPGTNSIGRMQEYTVNIVGRDVGKLANIVWDMGDGTIYTNKGASVTHSYTNYGTYAIKASGRCARCSEPFSIMASAAVVVDVQVPRASFAIEPDRETFSIRSHVKLKDTSSGDVDTCIWTTNGAAFATCGKGESVGLPLPNWPCEIQVGLRVENGSGASSEVQPRTLRVRIGGWLIVPVVIISVLLWIPFFRLLANNDPAGWRVLAWKGELPKRDADGKVKEVDKVKKKWESDHSDAKPIFEWWSIRDKMASIPPGELGLNLDDVGGKDPPSGNLIIGPKDPKVSGLASLLRDQSAAIGLLGIPNVEFYRFSPSRDAEKKAIVKGKNPKSLRIVLDLRKRAYRYVVALWVLTALLVATITWIIFEFAI